jgi:hypothetical protein
MVCLGAASSSSLGGRRSRCPHGNDFGSVVRYFALKVKLTVAGFPAATVTV